MIKKIIMLLFLILISISSFAQNEEIIINKLIQSKTTVDVHARMIEKSIRERRPLTGGELAKINEAATERLLTRDQAYAIFTRDFYLVEKRIKKNFTITDEELKQLILSLSVAVTLYDVTLYTYYKFHDNPKIRRLLNERDSSYRREENTFEKSIRSLFSFKNSVAFQRAIKIYDQFYLKDQLLNEDERLKDSAHIIEASYLYNNFKNRKLSGAVHDFFYLIGSKVKIDAKIKYDYLNYFANSVLYHGSKLFGNIAGSFQKRRGILHQDPKFLSRVYNALRPMDILLEKTPFRLTDSFIPGYWGHAAIYIGTQEDLEALGIWEHELVQKYAEEIIDGKFIVEALRDKVQMNTLNHFSDIDDFALLRTREPMDNQQLADHILRALSHVGKKYDFSFDVETGETIVCSELHYRTFIDLKFNTTPYIGRSTISVDQVAEQALTGMPLIPVMMYLNGIEVDKEDLQSTFDKLLNQKKSAPIIYDVEFDLDVA